VLGAKAVELRERRGRFTAVAHSDQGLDVPPHRLEAPRAVVPAKKFRAQKVLAALSLARSTL
jgi:hypothetical protein